MIDKNGKEIKMFDTVNVPEPNGTDDLHVHEFTGVVADFHNEYVVVEDGGGDCFCVEPERLELVEK